MERGAIRLLDGYQGFGRARAREEELAILGEVARDSGLLLDPVYTAKAFLGLADQLRQDPRRFGRRVLFLHTGGAFGLFPFRESLSRLLDGESLSETS